MSEVSFRGFSTSSLSVTIGTCEKFLKPFEHQHSTWMNPGTLFPKQTDVLSQDLPKSRSREIHIYIFLIALKFDKHLGNSAA